MDDKCIKYFNNVYLYDAYIKDVNNKPKIFIDKIKILKEILLSGAIETVYEVKYSDKRKAYIARDMYSKSKDEACKKLEECYISSSQHLKDIIIARTYELNEVNNCINLIRKHNND
jgi:hypothetical protein